MVAIVSNFNVETAVWWHVYCASGFGFIFRTPLKTSSIEATPIANFNYWLFIYLANQSKLNNIIQLSHVLNKTMFLMHTLLNLFILSNISLNK
jgi:hypothetical protein